MPKLEMLDLENSFKSPLFKVQPPVDELDPVDPGQVHRPGAVQRREQPDLQPPRRPPQLPGEPHADLALEEPVHQLPRRRARPVHQHSGK